MDASIGSTRISIIDALYKNPSSFQFDMAAYILESHSMFSFGKEISIESAPFRTKNLNCFYLRAKEIDKIASYNTKSLVYLQRLSISGLNAPLPTPYSELILNRSVSKDDTMLDFLNIFNERIIGISYQINKRHFMSLQKTEANLFLKMLASLNGELGKFNKKRSRLTYLFWTKEKSASGLQVILSSFFKTKVDVFECKITIIKRKKLLPLSNGILKLGMNSELGRCVYLSNFGVKIVIKNYDFPKLTHFINDKKMFLEAKNIIKDYIGNFFSCSLFINPKNAPPLYLREVKLGKNSWIGGAKKLDFISFTI